MNGDPGRRTRRIVFGVVVALAILHQDFWWWNDPRLVFGFLPIGLAYHALFSVLAASVWALVVRYVWPDEMEELADPAGEGRAP